MTGNIYPTMKRLIALAFVTLVSVTVITFAGEPVTSSKEVVPPPAPPQSYFRANEWSLGAFATYGWTHNHNERGISNHYWGGGFDGQYFPLEHLGFASKETSSTKFPSIVSALASPAM